MAESRQFRATWLHRAVARGDGGAVGRWRNKRRSPRPRLMQDRRKSDADHLEPEAGAALLTRSRNEAHVLPVDDHLSDAVEIADDIGPPGRETGGGETHVEVFVQQRSRKRMEQMPGDGTVRLMRYREGPQDRCYGSGDSGDFPQLAVAKRNGRCGNLVLLRNTQIPSPECPRGLNDQGPATKPFQPPRESARLSLPATITGVDDFVETTCDAPGTGNFSDGGVSCHLGIICKGYPATMHSRSNDDVRDAR